MIVLRNTTSQHSIEYIVSFIVFLIMPIIGILMSLLLIINSKANKSKYYYFAFLIALYLSGINGTKIFASDQIGYAEMYNLVPKYSIFEALLYLKPSYDLDSYSDPAFKLYCYIAYYITFGNEYLYFSFTSFIIYSVLFASLIKFFTRFRNDSATIVCSIIVAAFFFQLFNQTAHAIRQILAGSIIIYAISSKAVNGKNHWFFLLIPVLIHISSLFFLFLSLLPYKLYFNKRFFLLFVLFIIICTFSMANLSTSLLGIFNGAQVSYVTEEKNDWEGLSVSIIILFILPMLIILLINFYKRDLEKGQRFFLSISFYLLAFILSCYKNTIIQIRFMYYLYEIIPFVLPIAFRVKSPYHKIYCSSLSILVVIYFYFSFSTCIWKYADVIELLFYPYPALLFYHV